MLEGLLDVLFPKKCVSCGVSGHYVCTQCTDRIASVEKQVCPGCHDTSLLGYHHAGCRKRILIDQLYSGYWYKGVGHVILKHFKFTDPGLALRSYVYELVTRSLDEALYETWQDSVVCPVPLHWVRERKRGFNQSLVIAEIIAEALGSKLPVQLLKKSRQTKPQSELPLDVRSLNMKNVMQVNQIVDVGAIESVVLVDDVVTTGSTIKACARLLKSELKVKKVFVYTLFKGR